MGINAKPNITSGGLQTMTGEQRDSRPGFILATLVAAGPGNGRRWLLRTAVPVIVPVIVLQLSSAR